MFILVWLCVNDITSVHLIYKIDLTRLYHYCNIFSILLAQNSISIANTAIALFY